MTPFEVAKRVWESTYIEGRDLFTLEDYADDEEHQSPQPEMRRVVRRAGRTEAVEPVKRPWLRTIVKPIPLEETAKRTGLSVEACKQALVDLHVHLRTQYKEVRPSVERAEEIANELLTGGVK